MTRPGWPSAASGLVGIMGEPVAHSLTPAMQNAAFEALGLDWVSVGYPVREGDAPAALAGMRALGIRGSAVTMPHKEAVARLVDVVTPIAARLGAVNTLTRLDGGRFEGHNTDGEGFVASLRRGAGFDPAGARCVVLGAGGAARAVVLALAEAGASEVVVVNRSAHRASVAAGLAGALGRVGEPGDAGDAHLVVNATPTGMAGSAAEGAPPVVDASSLGAGQLAADLVYHPLHTAWLAAAAQAGAATLGGLGMLVHQSAAQVARWTGADPPVDAMWAAAEQAVRSRERS